jgi:hypothetical protein
MQSNTSVLPGGRGTGFTVRLSNRAVCHPLPSVTCCCGQWGQIGVGGGRWVVSGCVGAWVRVSGVCERGVVAVAVVW